MLISLFRETKGFFWFSCYKRSWKDPCRKTEFFCIHNFSKMKIEQTSKKMQGSDFINCQIKNHMQKFRHSWAKKFTQIFHLSFDQPIELVLNKLIIIKQYNYLNYHDNDLKCAKKFLLRETVKSTFIFTDDDISIFRWKACHSYIETLTPLSLVAQNKALKETCPIHHLLAVMATRHHLSKEHVYRNHGRNLERNHLVCFGLI